MKTQPAKNTSGWTNVQVYTAIAVVLVVGTLAGYLLHNSGTAADSSAPGYNQHGSHAFAGDAFAGADAEHTRRSRCWPVCRPTRKTLPRWSTWEIRTMTPGSGTTPSAITRGR